LMAAKVIERRKRPAAVGGAQLVHLHRGAITSEGPAVEIVKLVNNQAVIRVRPIAFAVELIDHTFRPAASRWDQLVNRAVVIAPAEPSRSPQVAGLIEDDTTVGHRAVKTALEPVKNGFRPAAIGRGEFIHGAMVALPAVWGGAIEVARSIEDQVTKRGLHSVGEALERIQYGFRPGAERAFAGSGRRPQIENRATAGCAPIRAWPRSSRCCGAVETAIRPMITLAIGRAPSGPLKV